MRHPEHREVNVVVRVGGDYMVPFLIDGDTAMYESDDIIVYLKENMSQAKKE